jgi:hypothetical protein
MRLLDRQGVYFEKYFGSQTLAMSSEELGNMFEGKFCSHMRQQFLLVLMGG